MRYNLHSRAVFKDTHASFEHTETPISPHEIKNTMNNKTHHKADKHFIDANTLLEDSFDLAAKILESAYVPDLILGIWRGGSPIAIAVHEFFHFKGYEVDHHPLRISSYTGIEEQAEKITIHGFDSLEIHPKAAVNRILIVDDVFDSGRSVAALALALDRHYQNHSPALHPEIRIACPWYKPDNNQTTIIPDYYLYETERWLVFPHELAGLNKEEIKTGKSPRSGALLFPEI